MFAIPLVVSGCADDVPQLDGPGTASGSSSGTTTRATLTMTGPVGSGSASGGSDTATMDTTAAPTTGPDPTVGTSGTGPPPGTSSDSGPMSTSGSSSSSGAMGDDGDCCFGNGSPGCEVPAIEMCQCALDAFCCDTEWDDVCAAQAIADCGAQCPAGGSSGSTTGGGLGDCCFGNGSPGCDDAACEAAVCAIDAFCCSVEWDDFCSDEAEVECPILCGGAMTSTGTGTGGSGTGTTGGGNDCCVSNGTTGCDDAACEASVCMVDPFCCSVEWDQVCADTAALDPVCPCVPVCGDGVAAGAELCDGADLDGEGCVSLGLGMGVLVCAGDCTFDITMCGPLPSGPCCTPNPSPGCEDPGCEAAICAADAFCCSDQWDILCVDAALMELVCAGVSDCPP